MKKRLFTALGLLLTGVAGAQTQKGNGLISGDVSINYCRSDNQYNNNTSGYHWKPALNITVGRFVADNWLLGLSVSGNLNAETRENLFLDSQITRTLTQRSNQIQVDITPFVRRYWQFAPVQVFAGAGLSVGLSGVKNANWVSDQTTQQTVPVRHRDVGFQVGPYLEAGANYFVTNRLALQLSVSSQSLPLSVANVGTGLVYWTGTGRKATLQPERKNGQTNRGNWIVEGDFSAGRGSANTTTGTAVTRSSSRSFYVSPSVGCFISKNNLLGISIPVSVNLFDSNSQNPSFANRNNYWSVGISPYFQHYWTSTRLTPYTRVGATYFTGGSKPDDSDMSRVNVNAAINIGLAYMAGKRFIIETSLANASLAYSSANGSETDNSSWDATLSAGLRGNFAVRYVLTRPD